MSRIDYYFYLLHSEEHSRLAEQKQWLDMEMEKVLNQRKQMEILDKVSKQKSIYLYLAVKYGVVTLTLRSC